MIDSNKNIKLLIFDFDGTLANTVPHIINCIIKCIDKFGLRKFSYEDIEKFNGAVLGNVLKELGASDDHQDRLVDMDRCHTDGNACLCTDV